MVDKVQTLPKDIQWHLIGHLQSNKVSQIAKLVNEGFSITLETVDSVKLAEKLNNVVKLKMDVMIEVKTSEEESKEGCAPD